MVTILSFSTVIQVIFISCFVALITISKIIFTAHFCGIFSTKHFTEAVATYSRLVKCLQENTFRPVPPSSRGLLINGNVFKTECPWWSWDPQPTSDDEQWKELRMFILASRDSLEHDRTRIFIKTRIRCVT